MTTMPLHKMAAPMWSQDGHHKMASRGGHLGVTRSARESNWGDQASRGGQWRGTQACRGELLGGTKTAKEGS